MLGVDIHVITAMQTTSLLSGYTSTQELCVIAICGQVWSTMPALTHYTAS